MVSQCRLATALPVIVATTCALGCSASSSGGGPVKSAEDISSRDSDEASEDDTGHGNTQASSSGQCVAEWTDGVRELDPDGPDTQIHSDVVFDGDQFWFAWNRPNAASNFDVFASSVACDGRVSIEPFMVSQSEANEVDPVLATDGEAVVLAWTGSSTAGLDIRHRSFGVDGVANTPARVFAAARAGAPVTGNATLPDLAVADDGFLLAGSWGHSDAPAFQAFAIGMTAEGVLDDEALDVELDAAVGQTMVDVAVQDGHVHLVWQVDTTTSSNPQTRGAVLGEGAEALGIPGARPTVVASSSGIWRAWDTNQGEVVLQGPDGSAVPLELGPGFLHSPQLAAHDETVVLLVMEVDRSIYNRLRLFEVDATGVLAEVPLSAEAAPSVYEASVVLVDGQHAVVAWQEGPNPAFRAYAEWASWRR